jgi:low affinity Fe/Cu permease
MMERFTRLARRVSDAAGHPYAFLAGLVLIIGWAVLGPFYGWSDTHSLWVNTITTCVTFLMVFLIQSSQNRDTRALQVKLDELIRVSEQANNKLISIEQDSDEQLAAAREAAHNTKIAECP